MAGEDELPDSVVSEMRRSLTARLNRYQRRLEFLEENPETLRPAERNVRTSAVQSPVITHPAGIQRRFRGMSSRGFTSAG